MNTVAAAALLFATAGPARPTDAFRTEHVEVKSHLAHVAERAGTLTALPPPSQKSAMSEIVGVLRAHLVPHAQWEERVLYPLVDEKAGTGDKNRFTASMRREHEIVVRWIDELDREAGKAQPDAVAFSRRTDNLLGLVMAHFECEEEVLLPVLDRTMTKAEFDKLLVDHH